MIQIQKIENEVNDFNTLTTQDGTEMIVYTSSGNFHCYRYEQSETPLKHTVSYFNKNTTFGDKNREDRKQIEFESENMKEVSAFKLFKGFLIITYWDSDKSK